MKRKDIQIGETYAIGISTKAGFRHVRKGIILGFDGYVGNIRGCWAKERSGGKGINVALCRGAPKEWLSGVARPQEVLMPWDEYVQQQGEKQARTREEHLRKMARVETYNTEWYAQRKRLEEIGLPVSGGLMGTVSGTVDRVTIDRTSLDAFVAMLDNTDLFDTLKATYKTRKKPAA
jgi:hypothetical protein